jgi:hypothetical protein
MIKAAEIFEKASILLNDAEFVRWPLAERGKWLNEAVRAIILAKPSASAKSIAFALAEGTLQKIVVSTSPYPFQLLDITRNIRELTPRLGGRAVRSTTKAMLDAAEPDWHNPNEVRFQREVRQFVFDEMNPLEFYVYPGNDGNGTVEAVVSFLPAVIAPAQGADVEKIESWDIDTGLDEPYSPPLLDYLLYRCQMKDDSGANAGRATAHYQQFATAVGLKIQVEKAASPNARTS